MTVVVLFYRTDLPYSVKTRPWHVWANRLPKPLKELKLLLISKHQFASGQTLKLENQFGFLTPELILYLGGHPIEASGNLLSPQRTGGPDRHRASVVLTRPPSKAHHRRAEISPWATSWLGHTLFAATLVNGKPVGLRYSRHWLSRRTPPSPLQRGVDQGSL
jgi:hypothetical protein